MLTKTIGQLSAATSIADADLIEIEQSGVSKYGTVTMLETNLITNNIATTAQSLLASSNAVLMTPLQVREAFSANDTSPVYAARAFVVFNGTTTTSSLTGTYTRVVGTTQTICVATAHGMITGNETYIDFTSGGGSDNTYLVTYIDNDTFSVNTVSTSSILTSTLSIRRCQILSSKNVNSVSYVSAGTYLINFSAVLPTEYPCVTGTACGVAITTLRILQLRNTVYVASSKRVCVEVVSQTPTLTDVDYISATIFG